MQLPKNVFRMVLACMAPLIAVLVLVLSTPAKDPQPKRFMDVNQSEWCFEYVEYVQEHGIMNGYSNDNPLFGPYDPVSRGVLATVIYRLATGGNAVTSPADFVDVPADSWCATPVAWCSAHGILAPSSDGMGLFEPYEAISLEELATTFYQLGVLCGKVDENVDFKDFPGAQTVSPEARQAFGWCRAQGFVRAEEKQVDRPFAPQEPATRAQCAKFAALFYKDVLKGEPAPLASD